MYLPLLRNHHHDNVFPYVTNTSGVDPIIRLNDRPVQPDPTKHIYQEKKLSRCTNLTYPAREWILLSTCSSLRVAIALAEPVLYLPGTNSNEIESEKSAVLRGSLCLHVLKPVKLRKVQLTLRGKARTEWPEGIPPKLFETYEEHSLLSHSWLFFHSDNVGNSTSHGAAWYKTIPPYTDEQHQPRSNECFYPGEYVYHFELPISCSFPESIHMDMGSVNYYLESLVDRYGTFSGKSTGRLGLELIRSPCSSTVATAEPILVSKNWEDRLKYEIQLGEKSLIMGQLIPITFKFTPLGNVQIHKIRLFLMERRYYYCRQRTIRRKEKTRQLLLYERSAPRDQCLLSQWKTMGGNVYEMVDQLRIPGCHDMSANIVHFDTTYPNIRVTHTLRTVLRFSCNDSPELMGDAKFLEICIDSPVQLLSCRCSQDSTILPAYCARVPSSEVLCAYEGTPIYDPSSYFNYTCPEVVGASSPSIDEWPSVSFQVPPPKYDDIFDGGLTE
ncbi:arrestin Aly1 [Schizosaccharomyces octosporus yFS286]|uniref:Arrestin Aly1 n=1 Tax=Schizosaccharomyces octosporus (strain yFS286) TaxID=483514 RepID=S9Q6G0_SCHOY|nr:arrestin Aly1 [Schizosaccharomyces octosporus yFS286]EPX75223.1 arrestin Aly1 [Schizosaccharomyces octosporus yFS286]